MSQVEIYDYSGPGYDPTMHFDTWRVAYLNYAERFDPLTPLVQERHILTDEVFLLLQGKATLIIGDTLQKYEMKPFQLYNVKKGCWHHIHVSKDAKVLIIENNDTSQENTEYRSVEN